MSASMRTALVTGGAGFIGHHIVRALVARSCTVRVLDDLSAGRLDRLQDLAGRYQMIKGSILETDALAQAMEGVDVVFHHAALVSVPASVHDPLGYHQVNATGTLQLLQAARAAGVKRIVYAASSAAYGERPEQPKREDQPPAPISPYAVSKFCAEQYLTVYATLFGLATVSLRYFNVFGPQQDPKSQYGAAIPSIVTRMLRGQRPIIFGDGQQTRDFCFVQNVVHANLLAAEAPDLHGQVLNIACGQRVSLNEVVRLTNRFLGTNLQPQYDPPRPGDVRDSLADISLAASVLKYQPQVYFEEGLRRSIDYYRTVV